MLAICPKLRTFKLWVTGAGEGEQLAGLGATLRSLGHTLDQITLVYPPHTDTLPGFQVSTLCKHDLRRIRHKQIRTLDK